MAGLLRHFRRVSSCSAAHRNLADSLVYVGRHKEGVYLHATSLLADRGDNLIPDHLLAFPVLKLFAV